MSTLRALANAALYIPGTRRLVRWIAEPRSDPRVAQAAANLPLADHGNGVDGACVHGGTMYAYDAETMSWLDVRETKGHPPNFANNMEMEGVSSLSVLTFNVMMDRFEEYVPGVIESEVRYEYISNVLSRLEYHVICLNEVNLRMLTRLTSHPVIRQSYSISDIPSGIRAFRENGFGNVVLVRRGVEGLSCANVWFVRSSQGLGRRSVVCEAVVGNRTVVIASVHLDARVSVPHFHNRRNQLYELYRFIQIRNQPSSKPRISVPLESEPKSELLSSLPCDQAIILGDFNLHQECESAMIQPPYVDVYAQIHPNTLKPTWSGRSNKLTSRMWLGCDEREMRLDRIILAGNGPLQPCFSDVVFTERIPGHEHLCSSDHYGLTVVLTVHQ